MVEFLSSKLIEQLVDIKAKYRVSGIDEKPILRLKPLLAVNFALNIL